MWAVALTGGVGCGKSTVARLFSEFKEVIYFSADEISHQLLASAPMQQALAKRYGAKILDLTSAEQRAFLAPKLIAEPLERAWLEQQLHPKVLSQLNKLIKQQPRTKQYLLLEIPLYLKVASKLTVDRVLVVEASYSVQLARLQIRRPNLSLAQLKALMALQGSRKQFRDIANDIIKNNTSIAKLTKEVATLHQFYLTLC